MALKKLRERVTLADVARAAGVSIATVDRALNARTAVSDKRMALVYEAARALNYHGVPALRARLPVKRPVVRIGVALRRRHNPFYLGLEAAVRLAATRCTDADVDIKVAYQSNNSPVEAAALIGTLSKACHTVALMAPDHEVVSDAVMAAREKNVLTFSLLSDFAIDARQAYLGLDNRKAGRTAAWGLAHTAPRPGALSIVLGNYSYLAQEMRDAGFRSYIREHQPDFSVVDTVATAESEDDVRHAVERLLARHADLVGLYVACGGFEGAVQALSRTGRLGEIALICNELTPSSREALIDRSVTMIIATPVEELARQLVAEAVNVAGSGKDELSKPGPIPFDLYVSENI